jgi:hypothetical protein
MVVNEKANPIEKMLVIVKLSAEYRRFIGGITA